MEDYYHSFHIPVMGTGHSIDTPIRVAPFGISSVISLVDDVLLERIRKYYSDKFGLSYVKISRKEEDSRARRVTAYLETVQEIVRIRMEAIRKQPFFEDSDKSKYFELLPDDSPLRAEYRRFRNMKAGPDKDALALELTAKMRPGDIDVNIMTKLDRASLSADGNPLRDEYSDAKAALRGYANSSLVSNIVFSAGINQGLYSYITRFGDFYRDKTGAIRKKIILKVSDFRSALIQGRFLAKKGLEVHEFRIESGLNCGGHAFPGNGHLLPSLLQEFKEKRDLFVTEFRGLIQKYYKSMGWEYPESAGHERALITVQGGIGTHGEVLRLTKDFGMDMTGWASPFLLVPEATCVDASTRELLKQAGVKDLYVSGASPLGIPFNNVRNSGSDLWTRHRVATGKPGSPCPKGFLVSNKEFTKDPICVASGEYQRQKLAEVETMSVPESEKERLREEITEKACICDHLGNGALIALGIVKEEKAPQCICPGPNIAWFNGTYTLKEMVDHIYGRRPSLVPAERPHMFAQEIEIYVDFFEKQMIQCTRTSKGHKDLQEFKDNLERGMDFCLEVAKRQPYPDENLASIPPCVERQRARLRSIYADFEKHVGLQVTGWQQHPETTANAEPKNTGSC